MKTVASHKLSALLWIFILQFCVQTPGFSQSVLNYQGRVISGGTAFNGTGQFKFAIVSSDGSTFHWKNDGTTTADAPGTAVSLPVNKGLFSVQLGDAAVVNMGTINSTVLSNSGIKLRVWFNDGVRGYQQVSPDIKLYWPIATSANTDRSLNLDLSSQFMSRTMTPVFVNSPVLEDSFWNGRINVLCSGDFTIEFYANGEVVASGYWGDSVVENTQTAVRPYIQIMANDFYDKGCSLVFGNGQIPSAQEPHPFRGKKIKWRVYNSWGESSTREWLMP